MSTKFYLVINEKEYLLGKRPNNPSKNWYRSNISKALFHLLIVSLEERYQIKDEYGKEYSVSEFLSAVSNKWTVPFSMGNYNIDEWS